MRKILFALLSAFFCSFNLFSAATYTDAPLYWGESTSEPSSGTLNSTYLTVYRDGSSNPGSAISTYTVGSSGGITSTGSTAKPKLLKSTGSATNKLYFQATGGRYFSSIKIVLKASGSTGDQTKTKNFIINTNYGPLKANQLSAVSGYYYGATGLKSDGTDVTLSNFDTYNTSSNGFDIKHNSSDKYDYIELTFKDTATVTKISLDPSSTNQAVLVSGYYVSLRTSCTSITPTLSYSSTSLAIGDDSSNPTVGGNTGSGAVTYDITTATPSGCATVDEDGIVTGVHAGTATVTATVAANGDYCEGTATANFTISCNSITPTFSSDYTSTTLTVDGGNSSTPSLDKDGSSGTVTWESDDKDVATVNNSGVVTPVAAGSATITATVAVNGDYCEGSVSKNFTINAAACSPSISASPSSANYCKDDDATALFFTGSGHNAQKWQYYDGDSWEDIDGATNATYTPSTSATGSTQYRVVTTCDSYTTTATSSAATVTVKTSPNLTISLDE